MRDLILLWVHILTTIIRVCHPGGVRSVIAESPLLKHQLLILNRSRRRAPNLRLRADSSPAYAVGNRTETFNSAEFPSDYG
jgi:hypothetical protein